MAAQPARKQAPARNHLVDADTLHPRLAAEADKAEFRYQREQLRSAVKQERISRSAPSFGLLRLGWRKIKDAWITMWQRSILKHLSVSHQGTPAVMRDKVLGKSYYNLRQLSFRYVSPEKREGRRMGFLKSQLNTNQNVHRFTEGIVRQIMEENLAKIQVAGVVDLDAAGNVRHRPLKQLAVKEIVDLYDRIETASLPHNRTELVGKKLSFVPTSGGVEVDAGGFVLPDIDPDAQDAYRLKQKFMAANVYSERNAIMPPSDFWDRGKFNSETHSDIIRTLFTNDSILGSIMENWKMSGHNLGLVLAQQRGALVSQVRGVLFPDSAAHEKMPPSATYNQMDAAVRISNMFGMSPAWATHYFWQIRNNTPNARAVGDLKREVTELEMFFGKKWRDYYFKNQGYSPEMVEKRREQMGVAFNMLMNENLDEPDDAVLLKNIRHIINVFQDTDPAASRERRLLEIARDLKRFRLIRQALATPTDREVAQTSEQRAARYGINPEEAYAHYQSLVQGAMHAQHESSIQAAAQAQLPKAA